jgi:hypothetical protein
MLGAFVMVRSKESGRMWIHDLRVWQHMEKTGDDKMFEVVTDGDDYESLRNMAKLTNYDMNRELFMDIKRGVNDGRST